MSWEKTTLTDRRGFENTIHDRRAFSNLFGGNINAYFKPFSTNVAATGFPHYKTPVIGRASGLATSSGLNPFGIYTFGEGLIFGTGMIGDMEVTGNKRDTRTFGLKTPLNFVGPSFDVFGYPAPNFNAGWRATGCFEGSSPSKLFLASGGISTTFIDNVPYPLWNAGPVDMRWDVIRGVFTSPASVHSARVFKQTALSGLDSDGFAFAETILYDVQIFDGEANKFSLTNIRPISPMPTTGTYKIRPLSSGDFCFLVHAEVSGRPGYAVWLYEPPGAKACTGTTSFTDGGVVITDSTSEDGTSTIYLGANQFLVGVGTGGTPLPSNFVAGTGITIVYATGVSSGTITINSELRRYNTSVASGSKTYTVFHNLNTRNVFTSVYDSDTFIGQNNLVTVTHTSTSGVSITFAIVTTGNYNISIIG